MKTQFLSTIFGAVLAIGAVASFGQSQSASAMTLPVHSTTSQITDGETALPVTKIHYRPGRIHRHGGRRHFYNGRRHGPRFRHRSKRNRHYYRGFWYVVPWWIGTTYYYRDRRYISPSRRSHVRWCLRRYRSYNPSTDTYRGYDGFDHRCNSPYR